MTALAIALAFSALVAGILAWRWLSLTHSTPEPAPDATRIWTAVAALDRKANEHESKLNALMLERGLRTSRETRA